MNIFQTFQLLKLGCDRGLESSKIRVASKSLLQGLRCVEKDFEKENFVKPNWVGPDELLKAIK